MGKIPKELRENTARNIRECRIEKFPGRGGGKKCAEAFGVSPQQWSPWERGQRTPDESRLKNIAKFFGKDVEFMRRDNRVQNVPPPGLQEQHDDSKTAGGPSPGIASAAGAPPGSSESFFWLLHYLVSHVVQNGIHVRYDYSPKYPGNFPGGPTTKR